MKFKQMVKATNGLREHLNAPVTSHELLNADTLRLHSVNLKDCVKVKI